MKRVGKMLCIEEDEEEETSANEDPSNLTLRKKLKVALNSKKTIHSSIFLYYE